jgi:hypothetical protein
VVRYSDVSRERTASIFEVTELVHVYAAVIWKKTCDACTKRSGGYRPITGGDGGKRRYDCQQPVAVLSTIVIFHAVAMGNARTCAQSLLFDLYLSDTGPSTTSFSEVSYTVCKFSATVPEGPYA